VDWNRSSFHRLSPEFSGRIVHGNGIDVDTLREAEVDLADVFIAVTNGDNRNLMAAQIAREIGAGRQIVRVYDPTRAKIFARTGLTTISPTLEGVERLFDMVTREEG
jgi:trk system potassium uptake protein